MYNKWTKYETYVKHNYVIQSHSAGEAHEGERIPLHFKPLYDHLLEDMQRKIDCKNEVQVVERSVVPRQPPLGSITNAPPRSERLDANICQGFATEVDRDDLLSSNQCW